MNPLPPELASCREEIARVDEELVELLAQRAALVIKAFGIKRKSGIPFFDTDREAEVIRSAKQQAQELGLPPETTADIFRRIIQLCAERQQAGS